MTKPYYENTKKGITLYCGDAREIVEDLYLSVEPLAEKPFSAILTDPVWPNAPVGMFRMDCEPEALFGEVAQYFPELADRVAIEMGINSDPRFMNLIPRELPFIRLVSMAYAVPSPLGRLLNGGNMLYIFGTVPPSRPGMRIIPGVCISTDVYTPGKDFHPCPRKPQHLDWQIKWLAHPTDKPVLDPFVGSGTTLYAAARAGIPAVGVELEERYCEQIALYFEGKRPETGKFLKPNQIQIPFKKDKYA